MVAVKQHNKRHKEWESVTHFLWNLVPLTLVQHRGYRWSNGERWISRDPIAERGFKRHILRTQLRTAARLKFRVINGVVLDGYYRFVNNYPERMDYLGLMEIEILPPFKEQEFSTCDKIASAAESYLMRSPSVDMDVMAEASDIELVRNVLVKEGSDNFSCKQREVNRWENDCGLNICQYDIYLHFGYSNPVYQDICKFNLEVTTITSNSDGAHKFVTWKHKVEIPISTTGGEEETFDKIVPALNVCEPIFDWCEHLGPWAEPE